MIDPITNTVMHQGKPMDAMEYYVKVYLPNSPTKQQLIDIWYEERQAVVQHEGEAELANGAIARLANYQLGS